MISAAAGRQPPGGRMHPYRPARLVSWASVVLPLVLLVVACQSAASSPGTGARLTPGSNTDGANQSSSTVQPAGATQAQRFRTAYVAASGGYLPLWVAQDAGFFRQHGLDV